MSAPGTEDVPALPAALLPRPRLLDRLDAGAAAGHVVVCAPAGSGKTTLLAHWARHRARGRVTWRTAVDGRPGTLDGLTGTVVLDGVVAPDPVTAVRALLTEAGAGGERRLVVLLRHDVAHELADLRLAGTVEVLQARDLVLSADEVGRLVAAVTGREVAPDLAEAVGTAIGGWAAGAAAVAERWDPAVSAADHREVLGPVYADLATAVAGVVAEAVDDEVLGPLRRAAALPALGADLWDDLLHRTDGEAVLGRLRVEGAFVADTAWHPDLLRLHPLAVAGLLDGTDPGDQRDLLTAGATWFLEHRLPLLAAWCQIQLDDWDTAAATIFANLFDLLHEERLRDLVELLQAVPPAVLQREYQWALSLSAVSLTLGHQVASQAILEAIGPPPRPELEMYFLLTRANWAGMLEDPGDAVGDVERALEILDELGDDFAYSDLYTTSCTRHWRVQARCNGLAAGAYSGEWERAEPMSVPIDAASLLEIPPLSGLIPSLGRRTVYLSLAGRLAEAVESGTTALDLAPEGPPLGQTAEVHFGLGEAARLRAQDADAAELLQQSLLLQREFRRTNSRILAACSLAHLELDHARTSDALAVLEAEVPTGFRPPITVRGRLLATRALAEHRLGRSVVAEALLTSGEPTAPLAAAGVQIALELGRVADAQRWLAAWPDEPTTLSRVLEAAARSAVSESSGHRAEAVEHLRAALSVAAPEGMVRPVAQLAVLGPTPLRLVVQDGDGPLADLAQAVIDALTPSPSVAALSDRERLVLHHLAMTATLPQVAERLVVSLNTLRSQTRAVYRKLGVSSRQDAVALLHPV